MYFSGTAWPPVHSFSFLNYMNVLFGIAVTYPISYQFWFIRDLMALVVFAPAIHLFLARKSALPFLAAMFCLWFFTVWPFLWPGVLASFFFSLGAYLSRPGTSVTYLDKFGPWMSVTFLGLLIFQSAFPESPLYLYKVVIFFGVPSLWWLAGLMERTAKLKLMFLRLSGASFFIFAAHEPLLRIIRKVLYNFLLPTSGVTLLALYFLIPICTIGILATTHGYLLKIAPSLVGFITGSFSQSNKYHAESAPEYVQTGGTN
jgi:hypothetical protein